MPDLNGNGIVIRYGRIAFLFPGTQAYRQCCAKIAIPAYPQRAAETEYGALHHFALPGKGADTHFQHVFSMFKHIIRNVLFHTGERVITATDGGENVLVLHENFSPCKTSCFRLY